MPLENEIAPNGVLRAAINVGNSVLTNHDADSGTVSGITVEIARDIASRLGLPLKLSVFKSAGNVVDGAQNDAWDIAFIARDPKRAESIAFTDPYILIEGSYLVGNQSPIQTMQDIDKPGIRVAVGKGAAYDLYLTRSLQHAEIIRTNGKDKVMDIFRSGQADVAAGIRQPLLDFASGNRDVRVLPGHFMLIEQTIATLPDRNNARQYLQGYVENIIGSGFVGELIDRFGKYQATVPKIG